MATHGLVGVHGRRRWRRGGPNTAPAPDLLGRDFTAKAPDRTEFACWDGELFLAGIKDHADRGPQYTSLDFSTRLADWGIAPSDSRTGNCFDNAAMESTWATIKKEIRHIHGPWSEMTRSHLRTILFAYIETLYNRDRHQARLGHRKPADVYADHAASNVRNPCPPKRGNSRLPQLPLLASRQFS
jgi:transposase InsO family protein